MKPRKSQMLLWGVSVGIIAAIILSLFSNLTKKDFDAIGASSLMLVGASNEAEKTLLYIDQSAKYSLQQAVYELSKSGGIPDYVTVDEIFSETLVSTSAQCSKFFGYSLWYDKTKDSEEAISCFDASQSTSNLQYLFNKNLNQYLSAYPHNIPQDNYEYEVRDKLEIIGKAAKPLRFDILKDESKKAVKEATEAKIETPKGLVDFRDFTDSSFCAKGVICMLTEDAYELLVKADALAKQKFRERNIRAECLSNDEPCLQINSAYRDIKKQIYLWEVAYKNVPLEQRRKKVCYPYGNDVEQRCPHLTGNAVDVVFKGKTTKTMNGDDWRLLHTIMTGVKNQNGETGWVRYGNEKDPSIGEPWHFECCGTDRYAKAKAQGVTAIA
ncbi:D-alanyl-D-alanine carboxypeptidase family protein [Candidatus Woesearchaeota archaeon]|nr:D-alanyl-D-alanine carboxypeptidase family protein [Candidatus Woesearchaeota archaeon]